MPECNKKPYPVFIHYSQLHSTLLQSLHSHFPTEHMAHMYTKGTLTFTYVGNIQMPKQIASSPHGSHIHPHTSNQFHITFQGYCTMAQLAIIINEDKAFLYNNTFVCTAPHLTRNNPMNSHLLVLSMNNIQVFAFLVIYLTPNTSTMVFNPYSNLVHYL